MIIKAILDLKQEVDALKQTVATLDGGVAVPEPHRGYIAPPPVADEPEEQIPGYEESEPQEISMRQMGDDLIERGIAPERIEAEGRGESQPIDTNDTEEGRQNNRRVEIEIL